MKKNPTLTGVTKGVVSGVASIAASGGDSKLNLLAWPMVRLGWLGCSVFELTMGVGEFNSHFRLGVQVESKFGSVPGVESFWDFQSSKLFRPGGGWTSSSFVLRKKLWYYFNKSSK